MRRKFILFLTFVLLVSFSLTVSAQNTDFGILAKLASGEVKSVDNKKIVLQTKDGAIDVVLSDKTEYKRIPADNPSLKAAVDATFADIVIGDKLIATGEVSADKKQIPANKVFIISKADIAKKLSEESDAWRTRGISGRVTAVNSETNQITISVKSLMGETSVVLTPKENAEMFRYSPTSNKFSDAKASNIKEINVGDTIRGLGDKSVDGASFAAEKLISGAFQTSIGTVKSIDTAKNEVVIQDSKTKQNITVAIGNGSQLKKFPVEMATRLAMMQAMQAGGATPPGGNRQAQGGGDNQPPQRPAGGQGQGAGAGEGRGAGRPRGDVNEIFDNLPQITAGDLKVGDMIAVSSSKTADASRITAIRLAAGIEPFLKTPQITGGGKRQGSNGQNSNFSIPGLDGGFDTP